MADKPKPESRAGVDFTNLDQSLFDGAGVTKRDLVNYLDAVHDRILPELKDRPLSVIRVTGGQGPFMQKNVPKYTPDWVATTPVWAEASKRTVAYALCNDRRTLLWFANQRAVEYHPTLTLAEHPDHATHLVLDLDPPSDTDFAKTVAAAHLVHQALTDAGLIGAVKTSGAKGLHVFVPIAAEVTMDDAAAATRAIARRVEQLDPATATTAFAKADREGKIFIDATRSGGATVAAAYSPRARPGLPVSFPVTWDELDDVTPADFTILNAIERLGDRNPWQAALAAPQMIPADLIAEGHEIPIARVAAMHEGKRRANARRKDAAQGDER
jgi:bifunctional non-homologous end joining protein LigD